MTWTIRDTDVRRFRARHASPIFFRYVGDVMIIGIVHNEDRQRLGEIRLNDSNLSVRQIATGLTLDELHALYHNDAVVFMPEVSPLADNTVHAWP